MYFSANHFKRIKISAVALIKMVMHARSGGDIEIMGLMQGKVKGGKEINYPNTYFSVE
jgi:proteasome lid subunit RPN8/RPN11